MTQRCTIYLLLAIPISAFAQLNQYDSRIDSYVGLRYPCDGGVQPALRIQNVGGETMTSCDIDILKNGVTESTFNWVLALPAATDQFREPVLPVVTGVAPGDALEFRILTVNGQPDEGLTENILIVPMTDEKGDAGSYQVQVKVLTDDNPGETGWRIRDAAGAVVATSPVYTEAGGLYETPLTLAADQCYNFEAIDAGGDGFGEVRELGYAKLTSLGADVAVASGDFGALYRKVAETGTANGCMPSKLTETADPVISCGATGLILGSGVIHATAVPGANKYQFRFTNVPGQPGYTRNIASPTRSLTLLKWATLPLKKGRSYNVQVRASFDNGVSWCPYGASCTIGISSAPGAQPRELDMAGANDIVISIFPNPSDGGRFNLSVQGFDEEATLGVEVFSITGERIAAMAQRMNAEGGATPMDLPLLGPGVYVIRVDLGDAVRVERVVVR